MMEELYDKGPFGYLAFFEDGSVCGVNQTTSSILKYSKESLLGANVEKVLTLPSRIFYQTHFFPLIKMQEHAEEIFVSLLASDNEHIPVLLNAKKMMMTGKPVICCAFIVVHNRKKFEDELVGARKAAEKALNENTALLQAKLDLQTHAVILDEQLEVVKSQNEELQQINHVVTHSLKEPLRKILMYSSILNGESNSPALEKMIRSAEHMRAVVEGLQEYVWLSDKGNDFQQVDMNEIVQHAIKQVAEELKQDLLNVEFENLVSFEADPEQMQILVYHVLMNAVKFKKHEKSTVMISSVVVKQNKFRRIEGKYQYEEYVKMDFVDDGMGFDPYYNKSIFELFRKLHSNEGHGVGLALCKKIADNHSGWIEAESRENSYTRITAWLPLKHPDRVQ